MLDIATLLTLIWLCAWMVFCIISISRGSVSSVSVLILIHIGMNGVPLLLDSTIGIPEYRSFDGFYYATRDHTTALAYCAYIGFVPIVFWLIGKPKNHPAWAESIRISNPRLKTVAKILFIPLCAPIFVAAAAPNPSIFFQYAVSSSLSQNLTEPDISYLSIVSLCTILSVVSAACIVMLAPKVNLTLLVSIFPWCVAAIWINGKRTIVAIFLAMGLAILWQKGVLRGRSLFAAGLLVTILFFAYSTFYQSSLRDFGTDSSFAEKYENIRVDYGRDSRIKMTIYAELHPDRMSILEYRGQSILFDVGIFIPRSLWPTKPLPYAQYFTSAMFEQPPKIWGWGMTTSWLEESIANFGWFGLLLGPVVPALLCRIGDSFPSLPFRGLSLLIAVLLLAVQFSAFAPLALLWLIMYMSQIRSRRRSSPRTLAPLSIPSSRPLEGQLVKVQPTDLNGYR